MGAAAQKDHAMMGHWELSAQSIPQKRGGAGGSVTDPPRLRVESRILRGLLGRRPAGGRSLRRRAWRLRASPPHPVLCGFRPVLICALCCVPHNTQAELRKVSPSPGGPSSKVLGPRRAVQEALTCGCLVSSSQGSHLLLASAAGSSPVGRGADSGSGKMLSGQMCGKSPARLVAAQRRSSWAESGVGEDGLLFCC